MKELFSKCILSQLNLCHVELIKMPRPLLTVSQSKYMIQIVDINPYTYVLNDKQYRSRSVGF